MLNDFEDLSVFFNEDEFAETASLNGRRIKVLFDRPQVMHQDGFAAVSSFTPQITCQSTDVVKSLAVQGSPVVVRKKNYTVSDIQDDGSGITVVTLHEAQQ